MIRTVVLEDQMLFRLGVKIAFQEAPDIRVAGEAKGGAALFSVLSRRRADVALLGVNQSNHAECVDVARRLRSVYPNMKILAMASENTDKSVQSMMKAGINGYIAKRQAGGDELARAIRKIVGGGEYVNGG